MNLTFDNIYEYLETNKKNLNFIQRDDVVTDHGTSKFCTLFNDQRRQDMPVELKEFLMSVFNITERDFHFLQVQKYEIGDYILPHKDSYPLFGLVTLSTSSLDGLVVEENDNKYVFYPDVTGRLIKIPKFRYHWVNPVREKTRYTAVYGLNPLRNYDEILDQ